MKGGAHASSVVGSGRGDELIMEVATRAVKPSRPRRDTPAGAADSEIDAHAALASRGASVQIVGR